jgi:hypothetical protein
LAIENHFSGSYSLDCANKVKLGGVFEEVSAGTSLDCSSNP